MKVNKTFAYLLLVSVVVIGFAFYLCGEDAWMIWNIPTLSPAFVDARIVTAGAESHRLGFKPEVENPMDPYGRPFNLPAIWKLLFLTGINQQHTIVFAGILIAAFLLGLVVFSSQLDRFSSFLLALSALSPPVFLAFERGNVELLVFLFCSLSLKWMGGKGVTSSLILWFAGILKVFPIFGLLSLLYMRKQTLIRHSTYILLAFSLYALLTLDNFRRIISNTEVGYDLSYGLGVLPFYVEEKMGSHAIAVFISLSLVVLSMAVLILSIYTSLQVNGRLDGKQYELSAFRLGAGIYVGTFLLGNNWDYRLIFLLFALPQLADWMAYRMTARYTLVAVVVSLSYLWLARFLPFAYFLDEIANWVIFAGLIHLLILSFPDWLHQDLQKLFGRARQKSVSISNG